jgi:anti-sigma B factor antagonist
VTSIARLESEWHDDVPVAHLEGEIDSSNVGWIAERLHRLLTNRSVRMVIDLSRTSYLDSAGINLLFAFGEQMRARQQRLALVVTPGAPIARMIAITGLDQMVPLHPTVSEALAGTGGEDATA